MIIHGERAALANKSLWINIVIISHGSENCDNPRGQCKSWELRWGLAQVHFGPWTTGKNHLDIFWGPVFIDGQDPFLGRRYKVQVLRERKKKFYLLDIYSCSCFLSCTLRSLAFQRKTASAINTFYGECISVRFIRCASDEHVDRINLLPMSGKPSSTIFACSTYFQWIIHSL